MQKRWLQAEPQGMRVISGKYKGRQLLEFKADNIRPTTDRVKETLFNKLMGRVEGARILDLFSGTGNLAIEALSREAAWVDIVENHRKSLTILKSNLQHLKIEQGYQVHPIDAFKYIANYTGEPYDVVIADPPFTRAWAHDLGLAIGSSRLLGPDTLVVIEASSKERVDESYPGLTRSDEREFGDKRLHFFNASGPF